MSILTRTQVKSCTALSLPYLPMNMQFPKSILFLICICFVSFSSGCDSNSHGRDDLARLEAEILTLIGDASASDVTFCKQIAFGSKPCGGPWKYLAYSTALTDSTELIEKVERYSSWETDINEREGGVSDCAFVIPPGVELASGACKLTSN